MIAQHSSGSSWLKRFGTEIAVTGVHWLVYLPAMVMFVLGIAFALWYTLPPRASTSTLHDINQQGEDRERGRQPIGIATPRRRIVFIGAFSREQVSLLGPSRPQGDLQNGASAAVQERPCWNGRKILPCLFVTSKR